MEEKRIKLKISAVMTAGDGKDAEKGTLQMRSEGVMLCDGTKYELRYDELTEDQAVACKLSFDTDVPKTLTLVREGNISSVMTFSEGARLFGNYNSDGVSLDFMVATKSLSNSVNGRNGGAILLDYDTEIQGAIVQMSKFRFDVSVVNDGSVN